MRSESVLFDLDGTLIDSGPLILASFRHATRTVLARTIPDAELMAGVGGHGLDAQMREFDEERVEELTRVYREHNLLQYENVQLSKVADKHDIMRRESQIAVNQSWIGQEPPEQQS